MIDLAMVGLGWWGRKMVKVIQGRTEVIRIRRAVEPNLAEAKAFGEENDLEVTDDLDDVLNDPSIRGVILATPHRTHCELVERSAAASKHVFCEKPLALTHAEAVLMVEACKKAGVVLAIGHERRLEPPMATLLADAESGKFGRLLQVEANFTHNRFLRLDPGNWRLDPTHAPAAGMTAGGIHLTDLSVKLMGPAATVLVSCERLVSDLGGGDTMSAHIRFRSGGTAYVSASLSYPFVSRFAIYGSDGWMEIREKTHPEAPKGWIVTRGDQNETMTIEEFGPAEPVLWNLEAFGHAIEGQAAFPVTTEEMVANTALLETIAKGAKTGRIEQVP